MKFNRIMIAAPKSGSGKTTTTCALLQALKEKGKNMVAYKCGPDYIDPMFHQGAIGIPSKNLDTFFTDEEETKRLFLKNRTEEEFAILEGVMGLYDGLGGIREEGSSYHLARITKTPIILVVDTKGMGRSLLPLLAGFLAYDKEQLIKGILFNRMSRSFYEVIKPLVEEELSVCVVGFLPDKEQLHINSRHLGLILPNEMPDIKQQLKRAAEELQKTVEIDKLIQIAKKAEDIECQKSQTQEKREFLTGESPIIAVAKDEAFCFYYEDNLLLLKEYGAKIQYFSPLRDEKLPEGCSGLLIGGGYPELYAEKLGENKKMLEEIERAIKERMPVVAECGGFMYLHSNIKDKMDNTYSFTKALPGNCFYTGKLVRFGYIEIEEQNPCFLPKGEKIRGHEFHYFDSEDNGRDCIAKKPVTGKKYPCVIAGEYYWLGFPHLYYPSNPAFAKCFVEKAREYKKKNKKI